MKKVAANIDEYISEFPPEIAVLLEKIRKTISVLAPKAEETIKYAMPTFLLNGNLIYFAAFKNHIGLYPAPTDDPKFTQRLKGYKTGRGSIQFPYSQPLPMDLIKDIVKGRIKALADKKSA